MKDLPRYPAPFSSRLMMVVAAVLVCLLAVMQFFIVDARGTDQHWYLNDTQTLIDGLPPETNTRYPGMILRQNNANPITYFTHNGPLLSINASIGSRIGALNAWKLSNFLMLIFAAALTALAVKQWVNGVWSLFTFNLYLLSPIAVWQSGNLLQEPFFALLSACIIAIAAFGNSSPKLLFALPFVTFLGGLSHPFFLVIGSCLCIYFLFVRHYALAALLLSAVYIAKAVAGQWFPSSFQPDLASIITSTVPGSTNMLWHFTDSVTPVTFALLLEKTLHAIKIQFFTISVAPLYLITNVGLISLAFLLLTGVFRIQKYRLCLVIALVAAGGYFGITVLLQNQARYQLIIAPMMLVVIIVCLAAINWKGAWDKAWKYCLAGLLAAFLSIDVYMVRKLVIDARIESQTRVNLERSFKGVSDGTRIAILTDGNTPFLLPVRALSPRLVLISHVALLGEDKTHSVLQRFRPQYILTTSPEIGAHFSGAPEPIKKISSLIHGGDFLLFPTQYENGGDKG